MSARDQSPRLATTAEVALRVGVSAATIARYAREERIPYRLTPGGHHRFDADEVCRVLGIEPWMRNVDEPLTVDYWKLTAALGEALTDHAEAYWDVVRALEAAFPVFAWNTAMKDGGRLARDI